MTDIPALLADIAERNPDAATRTRWIASMLANGECTIHHEPRQCLLTIQLKKGGWQKDAPPPVYILAISGAYAFGSNNNETYRLVKRAKPSAPRPKPEAPTRDWDQQELF